MIVERHVTLDDLYAVVRSGPCPWCSRADEHAHLIDPIGDTDRQPRELLEVGADPW